jgi:serine/threonine protein kinase
MDGSHYQFNNRLYESPETIIYRAYNERKKQHVILKCLKQKSSSRKKSAFKREYELVNALNVDGVIQTCGLETVDNNLTIVFEDFGGVSLQSYMEQHQIELREAIEISIQLTEVLGRIHDQFIIHNTINPSNIIIHEQSQKTIIIDFGLATRFSQEMSGIVPLNRIKSNISHISPEQTGRLDRVIDCRSDYYSLGMTIYELLTGKRPFDSDDEMEIIKNHSATPPPPLTILRPDIPEVLSDIVLKLLSKLPEERYQSIQGIVYDLKNCERQLKEKGRIDSFSTGKHDIPKNLRISQKNYGRDREINQLLNSFERICQGTVEMVVVKGPAGVGKTSLIREMYKPVTAAKGFFIDGKFDQLQRDIPYSAFIQAFKQLVLFLLTENKSIIDKWSASIQATLGPNGQIMIDMIPDLELIIGPQPEAPQIGPIEMKHRLYLVCQKLIKLFCQPEHPLIIFLDDLQWIDRASLKLLEFIVTDPDIKYLLILGAYRDKNVNLSHPLIRAFTQLKKKEVRITHLKLTNLSIPNLTQLIEDSLYIKDDNIKALATYIKDQTDGNPIHSLELIKSLHSEQLLYFDNSDSQWKWDMQVIEKQLFADNVVRILENRMKQLNPQTVQALKMASCLGNQFNLLCLSIICERAPLETLEILYEAISERFVISLNVFYEIEAFEKNQIDVSNMEYRFTHDRVQEAAKNLIPIDETHATHWRVGCLLRDNLPLENRSQNFFTIVSNLNSGIASLMTDILNESTELAKLNLEAGRKARASAAYPEYLKYLKFAKNLMLRMNEQCWNNQYQLMCDLFIEAAEAAYLSGNFDGMDLFVEHLEKHLNKNIKMS